MDRRDVLEYLSLAATATAFSVGPLQMEVRADTRGITQVGGNPREDESKKGPLPVIGFMLDGGMSQAEFVDAKEYPLTAYDSGVGSYQTKSGAIISNAFSELAPVAGDLTIVRTLYSPTSGHLTGHDEVLTHNGKSIHVDMQKRHGGKSLGYVYMEANHPGNNDFLGATPNKVRKIHDSYHSRENALVSDYDGNSYQGLKLKPNIGKRRFNSRLSLMQNLSSNSFSRTPEVQQHTDSINEAIRILRGKSTEAFKEPPKEKLDQYGNNNFGRAAYIAGKLASEGVGSIMIRNGHWDMRKDVGSMMDLHGPKLAQAIAALVSDIRDEEVCPSVVWSAGELGRTPIINTRNGRDHWPIHSGIFYGGAFKPGLYGETDKEWMPVGKKYHNKDIRHMVYRAAGLPPLDEKRSRKHKELFAG